MKRGGGGGVYQIWLTHNTVDLDGGFGKLFNMSNTLLYFWELLRNIIVQIKEFFQNSWLEM